MDGEKAREPQSDFDRPGRVRGRYPGEISAHGGRTQCDNADGWRAHLGNHVVVKKKKKHADDDELNCESEKKCAFHAALMQ